MQVIVDIDGVLADFIKGALCIHEHCTDTEIVYAKALGEWWLPGLLNLTGDEFFAPMGYDFWANLEPTHDGAQLISHLEKEFGQSNIALWSSPSDNPGCCDGKRDWVKKHLPKHYYRHLILGSVKHLGANPSSILVDDFDSNIDSFQKKQGKPCLVPRIWNRDHQYRHASLDRVKETLEKLRV